MLGTRLVGRDERQVDVGLLGAGQLHLGLLGGFLEPLQRHGVLRQVDALVLLELVHQPVDDPLIEVVTTEVGVSVGALDLEDALGQLQDGDVVGAATEVEDRDGLVLLLFETVGEAAAVGSLMIRFTSSPAILPASLVACRWASLK